MWEIEMIKVQIKLIKIRSIRFSARNQFSMNHKIDSRLLRYENILVFVFIKGSMWYNNKTYMCTKKSFHVHEPRWAIAFCAKADLLIGAGCPVGKFYEQCRQPIKTINNGPGLQKNLEAPLSSICPPSPSPFPPSHLPYLKSSSIFGFYSGPLLPSKFSFSLSLL